MSCRKIQEECKRSGERKQRGFDLTAFCASNWSPKTFFSTGDVIRVLGVATGGEQVFTGFDYVADSDGYTGEFEPVWPVAGSVDDGSLSWTMTVSGRWNAVTSRPRSCWWWNGLPPAQYTR